MLALSVAVVVWAGAVVPMPFYEIQPGTARPVEELVTLSTDTTPIEGDLDLLTIRQRTPNVAEALWVALVPDRELQPAQSRTPPGIELEEYYGLQRLAFETSFLTAVAVAAEEAGYEVELRTRAIVAHVLSDGPSDGVLRAGDTILRVDGVPVGSGDDLVQELGTPDGPRTVDLDVLRDDEELTVEVTMRRLPTTERPVLGIVAETVADEPDLPFEIELDRDGISGPSAGMMLALTAADMLLEEDLTRGRVIAGTGTIARDGRVGPVSGVEQKTRAAIEAEADLLLVPLEALPDTTAAIEAGIEVVGVETFQDALDAVRGRGEGVAAPG
jgi:PDZ domain-containing protein